MIRLNGRVFLGYQQLLGDRTPSENEATIPIPSLAMRFDRACEPLGCRAVRHYRVISKNLDHESIPNISRVMGLVVVVVVVLRQQAVCPSQQSFVKKISMRDGVLSSFNDDDDKLFAHCKNH